jgi:hypothetical protein
MTLDRQPLYPSRRAYVLKLRCDAGPDVLAGRLENLVTGEQREFASAGELLLVIESAIEASEQEPPPESTPA